jgi:hypothetical protein
MMKKKKRMYLHQEHYNNRNGRVDLNIMVTGMICTLMNYMYSQPLLLVGDLTTKVNLMCKVILKEKVLYLLKHIIMGRHLHLKVNMMVLLLKVHGKVIMKDMDNSKFLEHIILNKIMNDIYFFFSVYFINNLYLVNI